MRRSRGRSNGTNPNLGPNTTSSTGNSGYSAPSMQSNNGRRNNGAPNRHQIYDSNGPETRLRGSSQQIFEKYLALARDSQSAGDRVKTESYLQHAEHYYRLYLAANEAAMEANARMHSLNPQNQAAYAERHEDTTMESMQNRDDGRQPQPMQNYDASSYNQEQPLMPPIARTNERSTLQDPADMPQPSLEDYAPKKEAASA